MAHCSMIINIIFLVKIIKNFYVLTRFLFDLLWVRGGGVGVVVQRQSSSMKVIWKIFSFSI